MDEAIYELPETLPPDAIDIYLRILSEIIPDERVPTILEIQRLESRISARLHDYVNQMDTPGKDTELALEYLHQIFVSYLRIRPLE